jgi:hypothetical protein
MVGRTANGCAIPALLGWLMVAKNTADWFFVLAIGIWATAL